MTTPSVLSRVTEPSKVCSICQVGQLDIGMDRLAARCVQECRECLAEEVVPLELGVGEADHLRQERVRTDEALERVQERVLLLGAQLTEPVDRRPKGSVDAVVSDLPLRHEQCDGALDLIRPEHAERVEVVAGVIQQVRIGRRGDRRPVPRLEGGADVFGLVAEVEDEGAVLAYAAAVVRAIQPRQGLHGREPSERLIDIHRVELGLIEARLILLRDDQQLPLLGVELGGGL